MDYQHPDYNAVYQQRTERLKKLRDDPKLVEAAKLHYRSHPWDFVSDWGMTFEPRNIERDLPANIPFVLWRKQVEYIEWVYAMWQNRERGLVEKSRDCGVTWLSCGFSVAMWLFEPGFTVGFGSRKEELVDSKDDPKAIFPKIRHLVEYTPDIFMPKAWTTSHMKLINEDTGATIVGEAGDNIGRGGRASCYFVDEFAFIEHQDHVDRALSQTTNCQIDISTPNGNGNAFYRKRQRYNNTKKVFIFDWRDDPRKDDAWYQKQLEDLDEVTVAQEIDRDYNASQEDAFIPAKWVAAAIDAHELLGFQPIGMRKAGFDPADVGDAKALVIMHGSVIVEADQLTKGDITQAIPWALNEAESARCEVFRYDADGLGAPSMKLSLEAHSNLRMQIQAYYGSGAVEDPDALYGARPDEKRDDRLRTNHEMFVNYRAQTWTWLRDRFKATYEAVMRVREGKAAIVADPEQLISISSQCKGAQQLQAELSRPKRIFTNNGRIKVESKADMKKRDVDSPNLADALVVANATKKAVKKKTRINIVPRRSIDPGIGW